MDIIDSKAELLKIQNQFTNNGVLNFIAIPEDLQFITENPSRILCIILFKKFNNEVGGCFKIMQGSIG